MDDSNQYHHHHHHHLDQSGTLVPYRPLPPPSLTAAASGGELAYERMLKAMLDRKKMRLLPHTKSLVHLLPGPEASIYPYKSSPWRREDFDARGFPVVCGFTADPTKRNQKDEPKM
jgi:hypothetical protein